MKTEDYIEQAMVTSNADPKVIAERLQNEDLIHLLHAGMGMVTEAGEFVDGLKRHIYYGKEIDIPNLIEELGDICWYIARACKTDTLDTTFEEVMEINIKKLRARYGGGFSEEKALNRDLDKERQILEGQDA